MALGGSCCWSLMALIVLSGLVSSLPADNTMSSSSSVSASFSSSSVSASSSVSTSDKKQPKVQVISTTTTTDAPIEAEAPVVDVVELDAVNKTENLQPEYKEPTPEPEPKPEQDLEDLPKADVKPEQVPVKPAHDQEATVIEEVNSNDIQSAETRGNVTGGSPSMTSIPALLLLAVVAVRMFA